MNTTIRTIVTVAVLLSLSASQAHAGMFDWMNGDGFIGRSLGSALSFTGLSKNILVTEKRSSDNQILTIQDSAIMGQSSHTTPSTKRSVRSGTYVVEVSGYSSTPDQTDDSPFITASNTYVRDGIVATNFLPFGTAIKIPDLYGDKIFVVEDRMNKRYWHNVDIWFPDRQPALELGRRTVTIEVL